MSENENPQPDVASQFHELGENIKSFFQSAWTSEESQKFRQEIQDGLSDLGKAVNEAVEDIKTSEAGQKIKVEAEEFKTRVKTGEVEEKAREEVSKVLDFLNAEIGKLNEKMKSTETSKSPDEDVEI
jgi:hypothetical protein